MDAGNATTSANEQRKRAKDGSIDDMPRVKRQRVSRACDQCRAVREKCDGIKPTCGTCAFSERGCTYDTAAKKRGIQPGYIRTLELSLAWLFARYPTAEALLKKELAIENSSVQKLLSSKEGSESDRLHSRWSKGVICKQIDQLLSGADVSSPSQLGPESGGDEPDDGLSSLFPPGEDVPETHTGNATIGHARIGLFSPVAQPNTLGPPNGLTPSSHLVVLPEDDVLRLPADFWRLLDVYYSFIHSWLPISEKHDMLKTAYSYPQDGLRLQALDSGSGNHAELWAIVALAAHQINPRKQQDEIDLFMATARKLLPEEAGPFELGHVRALILLSLIYMGRSDRTPAWMLIGRAIRIAYDLRLHEQPGIHVPRRKHVMLACYLVEALLGRLYGMPCHLKGPGSSGANQLEEDGLEEWNPWDGGSNVTSQQRFELSRRPAQSLSMFNRLLRALGEDEGSVAIVRSQHPPGVHASRRSTFSGSRTLQHSGSFEKMKSGNDATSSGGLPEDSDPWTPQQLNFDIIGLWLRSERNFESAKESWPTFTQKLKTYIHCFGASRVPPTAVPLLEILLTTLDADGKEMGLRSMVGSLPHIWRKELPIQAIAFQTTPGQDASPASILGESIGSMHRHSLPGGAQIQHTINTPPFYSGTFGINTGSYRNFPTGPESLNSQTQNFQPPSNLPNTNMGLASNKTLMAPTMQPPATPSSAPSMDYMNPVRNQTADLEAIFEEIAMLDGTRSTGDQPEFMRNLGLGPNLDLSTFFGADYQPSDPLYSYLQPNPFGSDGENGNMFPNG